MIELLREFGSWYWDCDFDDPELRDAYDATGTATTPEEFERAFLVLLRSDNTVARGAALDFYDRAKALTRFGERNPFEDHGEEVLAVARELLRQPHRPEDEYADEGANHASALLALGGDAGPEDAEAVVGILARQPDGALLENALSVAGTILENSATPDQRLFAFLAERVFDQSLEQPARVSALVALREVPGQEVTAALVRAIDEDDWEIQENAAWGLLLHGRFYAHRARLARLVETLPQDKSHLLKERILDTASAGPHSLYWTSAEPESGELRAAHRELRTPTTEEAHRRAFHIMLHSEQVVAVGIALDHFHLADGLTRFGLDVQEYIPDTLAVAKEVLAQPLSPAETSPEFGTGANHASALHVLEEHARLEDAVTIAAALRKRNLPTAVLERALRAAERCLELWDTPEDQVVAALEELIFDESVDAEHRGDAVTALSDLPSPQVTAALVRATRSQELPIQIEAALALTGEHLLDEHRDLLRILAASWPKEAGYRAWLVRSKLDR